MVLTGLLATAAFAQDPTGAIEGTVTDATAAAVTGARVVARNLDTGFTRESTVGRPTASTASCCCRSAGTP